MPPRRAWPSEGSTHRSSRNVTLPLLTAMPRRPQTQPLHIAIDTGGTFTDCVWVEHGQAPHAQGVLHAVRSFASHCRSAAENRNGQRFRSCCTAPRSARIRCYSVKERASLWSPRPALKMPSKSAARPGPSFTTSFLIVSNRLFPRICALVCRNAPRSDGEILQAPLEQDLQTLFGQASTETS